MNDEKLTQLNELSEKIKTKKAVLKKIDTLSVRRGIVITDYNSGRVEVPEELRNVFFTLLRDYHQKQLDALEKEFEEM
ncbi:MAG TPA: hypothetical protein VFC76_00290 [Oscillospiraceae bacterium]|nr:hypothetical protein [Oscillospiraceae bacterium]